MATITKKLSTKAENGKKQILVRVYLSRNQRPRLKTGIFINPYYYKYGEIIVPKKSKLSATEDSDAILAKQQLEIFIEKVQAVATCVEKHFQDVNGDWIKEVLDAESKGYIQIKDGKCRLKDIRNLMLPASIAATSVKGKVLRYGQQKTIYQYFEHYCSDNGISSKRKASYLMIGRAIFRFEQYKQLIEKVTGYFFNYDTITCNEIIEFKEFFRNERTIKMQFPKEYAIIEQKQKEIFPMRHTHSSDYNYAIRSENYMVNTLTKIKAIFKWLKDGLRITSNNPFNGISIGVEKVSAHPFYITIEERNKVADMVIEDEELAIQRDIFVFQCLVGCRYGDLSALTSEHVSNGVLEYVAKKTRHNVNPAQPRIPLSKRALALVQKYDKFDSSGRLFPFEKLSKYNAAIKQILTLAGITRKVYTLDAKLGEEVLAPINEIATSHMARRTFVGNAYKLVKDPSIISTMSGHSPTSKSFARYRDIDDEMRQEIINKIE